MLSHARRRGLDRDLHMEVLRVINLGQHEGSNFTTHLGGLVEAPGEPSVVYLRKSRSTHVIILWNATQAQRDHKIIHARNFCVQPQAIMGSGIVE